MVVTGKNAENHILSKKVEKSGGQKVNRLFRLVVIDLGF